VQSSKYHTPVLLRESLSYLITRKDGIYVDATVGGGGHAEGILNALLPSGSLIAIDTDQDAVDAARIRLSNQKEQAIVRRANFRELRDVLLNLKIFRVSGIVADLGVSSHQIDEASRGFSFQANAPLDMRMDRTNPLDAAAVINGYDEKALADIFWKYGEERNSRPIARAITKRRALRPVTMTGELAEIVSTCARGRFRTKTLSRIFQSLRIEVNRELESLAYFLRELGDLLEQGGRCVIISYHSLEDRIVKEAFRSGAAVTVPSPHPILPPKPVEPIFRMLTSKPIRPGADEVEYNPRARSAKLRAVERV